MRYEMVFKVHHDSVWIPCTAVKLPLRTHRTSGEYSPMLATQGVHKTTLLEGEDREQGWMPSLRMFPTEQHEEHSFWLDLSHRPCEDYLAAWQAQAAQTIIFTSTVSV